MNLRVGPTSLRAAAVAACGFAWAWWASGPQLMMGLNWDTASYVALYASGQGGWRQLPWNSHFGLGPFYQLGFVLVRPFGGTFIDGVRCMGALAVALAAGTFAWAGQRLCGALGALWALVHVTAWAVAALVMTVEDNVLYLPFAVAASVLSLLRHDRWRWCDSVGAGVLVAAGILVSWQSGLYLAGPLYVAAMGAGGRSWRARVRDVACLLVAVVVTLNIYVLVFAIAAGTTPLAVLWRTLFSRPSPSFFPVGVAGWMELLAQPRQVLRHVGLGFAGALGPGVPRLRLVERVLPLIGVTATLVTVGALVWAHVRKRFLLATALSIAAVALVATALYVDLPADKHKRYDFVPLAVSLVGIAASASSRAHAQVTGRRVRAGVALMVWALAQAALNVAWAQDYRARLPERTPPGYHGRGTMPWYVFFRGLRARHPDACLFTLPLTDDLLHGRYQLEIPAALWSELPDHLLVGPPPAVADWPRRVKVVAAEQLPPRRPCEWRAAGLPAGSAR